jgi:DNA-binding FrmR family transcriptional regulator
MVHTVRDRAKLLNRVRRIRGQVSAIEGLLEEEADCERVLQTLAACRGALNGLMAEVLEDHVRFHVVGPDTDPESDQGRAAAQLVDLVRSYLR